MQRFLFAGDAAAGVGENVIKNLKHPGATTQLIICFLIKIAKGTGK